MPGTTWQSIPWANRNSSSSAPRPKMKGSPPLSRTTRWFCSARSTSSWLICSWGRLWNPLVLPTKRRSQPAGNRASRAGLTRRAWTTTSACRNRLQARRVSSPGSPGPAPTRATSPGVKLARRAAGKQAMSCMFIHHLAGDEGAIRQADFTVAQVAAGVLAPEIAGGPGPGASVAVADRQPLAFATATAYRPGMLAQLGEQWVGVIQPDVPEAALADIADGVLPPVGIRMH